MSKLRMPSRIFLSAWGLRMEISLPEECLWADGLSLGSRAGEDKRLHSSPRAERENSPFLDLFVPFGPSTDWIKSTNIGKDNMRYSAHRLKC